MEYISAEETAKKWGIGKRQVQALLANGRIPGAKKYGRFWMIPSDESKPSDLRCKGVAEKDTLDADPEYERQLYDEIGKAYFVGNFEYVKRCYREVRSSSKAKLRIASEAISAAISTGDYPFYSEIESYLKNIIKNTKDKQIAAEAQLSLSVAYVNTYALNMIPQWLKDGDFSALQPSERLNAAQLRAKYLHGMGDYSVMLAVAQTALSFCNTEQAMFFPGVYLKLMCAQACNSMHNQEEASKWLQDAMHCILPYGFITPFAEMISMFDGLVQEQLTRYYPQQVRVIMSQWEKTFSNWVKFHNLFTKNNITQMLSLREYQMATLAAQGIPSKKIAERQGISLSREKSIMKDIYAKLCISNRRELSGYILIPPKTVPF